MNNNFMQVLLNSKNPQQMAMNLLKNSNSPIMRNVFNMINQNNTQGIENVARNIAKEKGVDVDSLMNQIKNQYYSR